MGSYFDHADAQEKEINKLLESFYHVQTSSDYYNLQKVAYGDKGCYYMLSAEERKLGHFPYIPFYPQEFVDRINWILRGIQGEPHFIDVGCGIGDKLLLAQRMCGIAKVSGVEYNLDLYLKARDAVGSIAFDLLHDDAFNLDYSSYNLIYMYSPLSNGTRMAKLFEHVVDTAADGAIIAEMLPGYIKYGYFSSPIVCGMLDAGFNNPGGIFKKTDGRLIPLEGEPYPND